jgi:hypothetical protein
MDAVKLDKCRSQKCTLNETYKTVTRPTTNIQDYIFFCAAISNRICSIRNFKQVTSAGFLTVTRTDEVAFMPFTIASTASTQILATKRHSSYDYTNSRQLRPSAQFTLITQKTIKFINVSLPLAVIICTRMSPRTLKLHGNNRTDEANHRYLQTERNLHKSIHYTSVHSVCMQIRN